MTTQTIDFDPTALGRDSDPYDAFRKLRKHGPVWCSNGGFVVVVGYAVAQKVLRDRRFLSGPIADVFRASLPPGAARDEMSHRINFLDPPDHPRVRGLVNLAFTPRRIEALREPMTRLADELIEPLAKRVDAGGHADILRGLSSPFPSLVISEMLGVPVADRGKLSRWTEAVTPLLGLQISDEDRNSAVAASEGFSAYVRDLVAERRHNPGDDLVTALSQAHDGGGGLSEPELLSLIMTLYSAGHRTTRDLFTNGLFTLLGDSKQRAGFLDAPRIDLAVQEFLRFAPPTLFVVRIAAERVELEGVAMDPTMPVLVMLGAANRDPERFTDPERFDIARDEGRPLSFAIGPHACLGQQLARAEAEIMVDAVARRLDLRRLRIAEPAPRWTQTGTFRGLDTLRVSY